jgi:hypothetical protein
VVEQGLQISHRMQGLEPEEHDIPHNPSNEGTINEEVSSEIGSLSPPSDHPEGAFQIIEEGFVPPTNPPFTGPYNPLVVELPSTSFIDSFSSYRLPPDMYNR